MSSSQGLVPASVAGASEETGPVRERRESQSQRSEHSQTAADFLREQMQMEADAREAMPYSINTCTHPLGPLRQNVYACITCNPPSSPDFSPAGICYACSVQCHGEHTLVEIFQKRNFTCDCGTTRLPSTAPCAIRINPETNTRSGVHSQPPDANNRYNKNFANRFCGCCCDYDPFDQKGTMFQCTGLGNVEDGGCGEDWYHPGCLVGLGPKWFEDMEKPPNKPKNKNKNKTPGEHDGAEDEMLPVISEEGAEGGEGGQEREAEEDEGSNHNNNGDEDDDEDVPMPAGFPEEEAFEGFLCYKCVDANPWIKQYAGTPGFLPAVYTDQGQNQPSIMTEPVAEIGTSNKRKSEDGEADESESKRHRSEAPSDHDIEMATTTPANAKPPSSPSPPVCKLTTLPPASTVSLSLFFTESFRSQLCRCPPCHHLLNRHPQLLDEEEVYEPPLSSDGGGGGGGGGDGEGSAGNGGGSHGSGSLYDRGESALRNVDRVRAIEGVMAYNHLKEQLKPFFAQFAGTGKAISAEDIKEYFAKLRGDEGDVREAGETARTGGEDQRKEQDGY